MGAGMMFHKCKPCLGVGFVEPAEIKIPSRLHDSDMQGDDTLSENGFEKLNLKCIGTPEIVLRRTRKRKVKPDEAVCHAES